MDDAVLDLVEHALLARGIGCVRFNFRGVGMSGGSFDHGNGETFDLRAVAGWARANKGATRLWLAGYSFGSQVVWSAATDLGPDRVWLIAPPIGRMSYPSQGALAAPVDVFIGTADDFADLDGLDAWRRTAARDVRVHTIDGGDHFFSRTGRALAHALEAAASEERHA